MLKGCEVFNPFACMHAVSEDFLYRIKLTKVKGLKLYTLEGVACLHA